jgi:hypothetical protein
MYNAIVQIFEPSSHLLTHTPHPHSSSTLLVHTPHSTLHTQTTPKNQDSDEPPSTTVHTTREFHQMLIVGLIEAYKGIAELYQSTAATATTTTAATVNKVKEEKAEAEEKRKEFEVTFEEFRQMMVNK